MTSPGPIRKRSFVVTLGLLTGMAAFTVDVSLPAVPALADALATSLSKGQLIIGAFMAGMALGQLPAGLISDRVGRMPVLYFGMTLFAAGAVVAVIASTIDAMLWARFVQGLGASSSIVVSRAIVRDVASGKDAARLMSVLMMIFTAAPVIAPSIGAILVTAWGWRSPLVVVAVLGFLILGAIRSNLSETHQPAASGHPLRQLLTSTREFFSHRQSIFGLMMLVLPPAGFLSVIPISSALIVESYGMSLQAFGLIFACAGLSILLGSVVNRAIVTRFDMLQLITIGVVLLAICGGQLLLMMWLNQAPLWWFWGNVCLFMFTTAILMPNALVVALDPMPRIAGVASSIVGTAQSIFAAAGAIFGSVFYDGSVRNSAAIMALAAIATVLMFLLKPLIAPGSFVHHPDELARD